MKKKRVRFVLALYWSAILAVFLYIFQHEFGHAIVIFSTGARLTEFSILNAHVSYTGGNWTDCSSLWMNANGAFFPLLFSYVFLLCYRSTVKNLFYRVFALIMGIIPSGSIIAWVYIPFLYMNGSAPFGDDVTKFLDIFCKNHSPLLVIAAAVILILVSIFLIVKKQVLHNFIEEIKNARKKPENEADPGQESL